MQESYGRFTPLGYGCAGSAGEPSLGAAPGTVPRNGQTFDVQLGNLPAQAQIAFGAVGFSELPGVPLASLGLPGCHQFVSTDVTLWASAANGAATLPLTFPAAPALQGTEFWLQAVVPDPTANPLGLTVSNAAACTIG
ncbi:MAG: hypothetical protein IPK26_23295 [Planctomycetes bacterium]|nr:hypothetical protein [Planctomycetota bacterium]